MKKEYLIPATIDCNILGERVMQIEFPSAGSDNEEFTDTLD